MEPLNALWHLMGFAGPVAGLSLIAAVLARWVWWRELGQARFLALWGRAAAGCAIAQVLALVMLGGDGQMLGYAGLILGTAAGLWWGGWGWRR
jgi:hypothetical protein